MNDQTLLAKLNFKSGMTALLLNVPDTMSRELTSAGLAVVSPESEKADGTLFMVDNSERLNELLPWMRTLLKKCNMLWIAYPKGGSGVKSDLNRDILWKILEPHGFRPVRQVAVDTTWSALRFKEGSGPLPGAEKKETSREIVMPEDFSQAVSAKEGVSDFFNSLAFTHRKEYVRWIEEARRPETRLSRIEKAMQLLAEKKKLNN